MRPKNFQVNPTLIKIAIVLIVLIGVVASQGSKIAQDTSVVGCGPKLEPIMASGLWEGSNAERYQSHHYYNGVTVQQH